MADAASKTVAIYEDAANLANLHDIVMPEPVSWWPLAPGWLLGAACLLLVLLYHVWRSWKTWRANAYRREALRQAGKATSLAEIGAILRRCALVLAPRDEVASLQGEAWPAWLRQRAPGWQEGELTEALASSLYSPEASTIDLEALRSRAVDWISTHRGP